MIAAGASTRVTEGTSRVVTVTFPLTAGPDVFGGAWAMASDASASPRPVSRPVRRSRMGHSLQNMAKFTRYLKLLALGPSVNGGGGRRLGSGRPAAYLAGIFPARKLRNQAGQIAFCLLSASQPLEDPSRVIKELVAARVLRKAFLQDREPSQGSSRRAFSHVEVADLEFVLRQNVRQPSDPLASLSSVKRVGELAQQGLILLDRFARGG